MEDLSWVPPQVAELAPREREIATIIYRIGACTARDVELQLKVRLSNSAVRTMLMRMVKKGVLRRSGGRRGRGQPCTYLPSVTPDDVKQRALEQTAKLYFEDSLATMAIEAFARLQSGPEIDRVRQSIATRPEATTNSDLDLAA